MKLATLKTDARDGELVICSRDLSQAASAASIAPTLQHALDHWSETAPRLADLAQRLDAGRANAFKIDMERLAAPLPRPFGWIDSSVYLNHMELARRLRKVEMPDVYRREPLLSPRLPDPFLGPRDAIPLPPGDLGLDIEAELAVIVGDIPQGASAVEAGAAIRLLTLVNDISLRTIYARDVARGKTTFHGKSAPAMAPVAVTPDELGDAWDGGTINLPLTCTINGALLGQPHAGIDMSFKFPAILEHAVLYRGLGAGTVIGSGTVSNRDPSAGSCCIAERRMLETLEFGEPRTPYLKAGDEIRIEMFDRTGKTAFGAIQQKVQATSSDRSA